MKGSLWDKINVLLQFFLCGGVAFVGMALHVASGHESAVFLALAWVWVSIVYVLTMYRFYEESEKREHEKSHIIIKLEYEKSPFHYPDFSTVIPDDLDEIDRKYEIDRFCKDAIYEKLMQESRGSDNV